MLAINDTKVEKIFVSNDNMATFVCPACTKTKTADVSKYNNYHKAAKIRIRCACGNCHFVVLERRKYFRKRVNMQGACIWGDQEDEIKIPMMVKDLSCYGLRCEMTGSMSLETDDRLLVEFRPNSNKELFVRRDVIIRNLSDSHIGAEFSCKIDVDFLYSEPSVYTFPKQFRVVLP